MMCLHSWGQGLLVPIGMLLAEDVHYLICLHHFMALGPRLAYGLTLVFICFPPWW